MKESRDLAKLSILAEMMDFDGFFDIWPPENERNRRETIPKLLLKVSIYTLRPSKEKKISV